MSDWSDYAREVQAAADSAGRRADTEMKSLKCRIQELEKACKEWSEVSQSNYQRAKAAEAELAKVAKERDEWQSLAEAAITDDAAKNIHYAEIQAKLAVVSHNATAFGHKIVSLESARDKAWKTCLAATTKGMELEAKLAIAVNTLEEVNTFGDCGLQHIVRPALAKIKGEQP